MYIIPHFFSKEPIPTLKNNDLQQAIDIVSKSKSKEEALKKAYELITSRFESSRLLTYLNFWRIYQGDPDKLWDHKKFLHCTQQNFLLRILLVKSSWFIEDDIALGYSFVWHFSPHQYLKVKINNNQYIAVDSWNHDFGVPMGYYATGFGSKLV